MRRNKTIEKQQINLAASFAKFIANRLYGEKKWIDNFDFYYENNHLVVRFMYIEQRTIDFKVSFCWNGSIKIEYYLTSIYAGFVRFKSLSSFYPNLSKSSIYNCNDIFKKTQNIIINDYVSSFPDFRIEKKTSIKFLSSLNDRISKKLIKLVIDNKLTGINFINNNQYNFIQFSLRNKKTNQYLNIKHYECENFFTITDKHKNIMLINVKYEINDKIQLDMRKYNYRFFINNLLEKINTLLNDFF